MDREREWKRNKVKKTKRNKDAQDIYREKSIERKREGER